MKNGSVNGIELSKKNEKYIEQKVKALSVYNTYWCLLNLYSRGQLRTEEVRKNDSLCRDLLSKILKRRYSTSRKDIDAIFETSAINNISFAYVKWFYENDRAALWLIMVLKGLDLISDPILTEADISVIIHNIIFNKNIFIRKGLVYEGDSDDEEWIITSKKLSLTHLKQVYIHNKVSEKNIKWLTNRDNSHSSKINYVYKYMQNIYDIDNLLMNKEQRKNSNKSNKYCSKNINKNGYRQALIYGDRILFPETDTDSRLHHILASLDYWTCNDFMIDEYRAANRALFIKNMYDAWNAQQKRDRDKIKKQYGIDLTNDNKKNLKHLAKACGKTQSEVLNDLVEFAHSQIRNQEIKLAPSFPNQYKAFDKITLEKPSSLPSEHTEREVISEDTFLTKDKQELSSDYDAVPVDQSRYDNSSFLNNIPQAQSSSLPSERSDKVISKVNEEATTFATSKQKVKSIETFPPKGNYGKQPGDFEKAAEQNARFIENRGKSH
ncbi:hypothetical protein AB8P72_12580 [Psychrobacter sp. CLB018]|uniref:hypothetical protein n=1 Tax=Psychrobacter sp. CLB018 TaxID=3240930 RepID=UPI00351904FA